MKSAFTLIELVVVFVIIALLAALLLPAMSRMRWQAKKAACVNNLRQIGIALLLYADEHDDALPPLLANPENPLDQQGRHDAPDIYPSYIDDIKVFHEPAWHDKSYCLEGSGWPNSNTYAFNWSGPTTLYESDGSIIPASIRGGTYIIAYCGSYSGGHGALTVPGDYSTYTGYTGKNVLWSDGRILYVYAGEASLTAGKTPRAIFNKPNEAPTLPNAPRTWR